MGRQQKYPERLYISPPETPTSTSSSFLSFKSATASSAALLSETSTAVGEKIPGFKTSAAFLTSLRANLSLAAGDLFPPPSGYSTPNSQPSQLSTPDSLRPQNMSSSVSSLAQAPPSSPLASEEPSNSDSTTLYKSPSTATPSDLPPLTTSPALNDSERIASLKLVADSIAQQRQAASNAVLWHPLSLSALVLVIALLQQYFHLTRNASTSDWVSLGISSTGILMTALISVRYLVAGYIYEAERVGTWKWLGEKEDGTAQGPDSEILVTRYGEEIIGCLVYRTTSSEPAASGAVSPKKARKNAPADAGTMKCVIRAWTVKQRYRGREIGLGLLEEVVRVCREKGWQGPEFDAKHANSKRFLWGIFNGGFEKGEKRARAALERVVDEVKDGGDGEGESQVVGSSTTNAGGAKKRK